MNTNYFKEIAKYYQQGGMPQDGMEQALMQAAAADASASTQPPAQAQPQQQMQQQQPDIDLQAMLDDPNSGIREVRSNEGGEERILIVDESGNVLGERTVINMDNTMMDVLISPEGEVLYVFGPAEGGPTQMQNGGYIKKLKGFR